MKRNFNCCAITRKAIYENSTSFPCDPVCQQCQVLEISVVNSHTPLPCCRHVRFWVYFLAGLESLDINLKSVNGPNPKTRASMFLSPVTQILVFERMPWLDVRLNLNAEVNLNVH